MVAVHALGARVMFELFEEIGRHHGIANDVDSQVERYAAALYQHVVHAVGADLFS
jgi:hypothetical protein